MKRLILALLVLAVAPAVAQTKGNGAPKYDPATEVTITGTITELKDFNCPISGTLGSHAELQQADGTMIEVHLAPVKFMKSYGVDVSAGPVTVVGSKVTFNGAPTIEARTLTQKGNVYQFRDEKGKPYW